MSKQETESPEYESVSLKYLMRVLREHRAEGNLQSLRILGDIITDPNTRFSDERVWWKRES